MSASNLAQPELEGVEIHDMTRSAFILRSALAAGAVYGAGAVGPFVRQAFAQGGGGDVEILNFALTLEFLEAEFYDRALDQVQLPTELRKLSEDIRDAEREHVDALSSTITELGGRPTKAPTLEFPLTGDQGGFLELAQTFEDTGVAAYNGAAPSIKAKEVLAAAGSIVQVEARHAAAIRLARKQDPAPAAFDETMNMQQVLNAVKPFVKS